MRHFPQLAMRAFRFIFACTALFLAGVAPADQSPRPHFNGPHINLSATDVVKAQLAAFQNNDDPTDNAGIAIAFSYASPGNRRFTGPLENFTAMLLQGYPELINHRSHRLVKERLEADEATVAVIIESSSREIFNYVFRLSRQYGGECSGCWMTDAVVRESAGSVI